MTSIDQALREMARDMEYPETPDLTAGVSVAIAAIPVRSPRRRATVARVAAVAAVLVLVVALIPAAREQVASWLGIRGVTIEDVSPTSSLETRPPGTTSPPTTGQTGAALDLGTAVALEDVEEVAGFVPLVPSALGPPDEVFVGEGRVWFLYATRPGLPETLVPGVGAIVTQFPFDTALGLAKQVVGGVEGARFVEVGRAFGVWIEGPHQLIFPELAGSAVEGRSAGNTLIWEGQVLTSRLETSLPLERALEIALSFE